MGGMTQGSPLPNFFIPPPEMLAGETDGLAIDFTATTDFALSTWAMQAVQERNGGVDTLQSPHVFFTNSGTSPKYVQTSATGIGFCPHNLTLQSQTLDNAAWTATAITVTANDTTAPDNTATAEKLVETNTSTSLLAEASGVTIVSGVIYTVSIYAKSSNIQWLFLNFGDSSAGTNGVGKYFDLTNVVTGTTTTAGSGWSLVGTPTITSIGSGWYRLVLSVQTGTTTSFMTIRSASADNSTTRVSSGTYWLWGAQRNRGNTATAYIVTTAAAVIGLPISYGQGLLVEPAATNLILSSEIFGDTLYWHQDGITSITDGATAPNGSTTADTITESTANTDHRIYGDTPNRPTIAAGSATASIYYKAGSCQYIRFLLFRADAPTNQLAVTLDTTNNTLGTPTAGGAFSGASAAITVVGNGWYRLSLSGTVTNDAVTIMWAHLATDGVTTSYIGTSRTSLVWGAQIETGAVATSFVPTIGATATRATDKVNAATSTFPWTDATGSVVAWITPRIVNNSAAGRLVDFSDGATGNEVTSVEFNTADAPDSFGLGITDGGSVVVDPTVTKTGTASTSGNKVAAAWQLNSSGIVVDASAEVTDTSCTMPSPTSMSLGYSQVTASRELNGFLKRLIYVPRRMTQAEMQAKTT